MKNQSDFLQFSPKKKTYDNRKNAIIYTRVSTKEQADNNTSLGTQKSYCENYAKQNGFNVIGHFGGTYESAKTDERKEFIKLIKFAKQNLSVGYIIVYSYDRFSRSGPNASIIIKELLDRGIEVISVTQTLDSKTASGTFQQSLFLVFSQFDNEMRRDKTNTAMVDLLRKGYWLWTPPRGYVNSMKYHKAVDWDIVINAEGEMLKKAFKWRADSKYTNSEIVSKLNLMGMKIDDKRLLEIFKNPFYCGILISRMIPGEVIEGKHEHVVSQSDFLKINTTEARVHPLEHKSENEEMPLRRFAYCIKCNTQLTGFLVKKKNIHYYKCRGIDCGVTKNATQLNDKFKKELEKFEINPIYHPMLKEVMEYTFQEITKENTDKNANISVQLTLLNKKLSSIEERFAIGEINSDLYEKFSSQYSEEIQNLAEKKEGSSISSSNLKKCIKSALDISSNLSEKWESASMFDKHKLQNLVYPSGIGYDKLFDRVQTPRVNSIFSAIPVIAKDLKKIKNGNPIKNDQIPALVTSLGFKPKTSTAVM